MKTYLITGGAGFLGSNLAIRLIKNGQKVIVVDDLFTGRLKNLAEIKENPNFRFIKHDVRKPLKIDGNVDYVCHLACPASPPVYLIDPIHTLETSAIGTQNMLEFALSKGARFFYTSTSEIYGDPLVHPQKESYFGNVNPYCKRSCYDEGKRYAEALIYEYRRERGLNTGIIRIFNTYGPKMDPDDGRVVTNFIKQALRGEDITVQGDGKQTRSFCYVDDQIDGMIKMIKSNEEGPINIGNPNEFTILELAKIVIDLTKTNSKIVYTAPVESDPKQRRPDIKLAKEKLNWKPKINLREGIKKTMEYLKAEI
ncbi:MAG: UDP-glucuronic acid decarboxylase family protein [Patescibacteria group bacterium]